MKSLRYYVGTSIYNHLLPLKKIRILTYLYGEMRMILHVVFHAYPSILYRRYLNRKKRIYPRVLSWKVNFNFHQDYKKVISFLKDRGIRYKEGGQSIYIPPQDALSNCFREMYKFYPKGAGFKILHNISRKRFYLNEKRGESHIFARITGSTYDYLESANLLNLFGLGPKVYDLTNIIDKSSNSILKCFVVEHIDGVIPTIKDYQFFIKRMQSYIESKIITLVPPEKLNHIDFKSPDCGGNLIKSRKDGRLYYIDAQQIIFTAPEKIIDQIINDGTNVFHFGQGKLFTGGEKYLYQDIPGVSKIGKRDSQKRWMLISDLLHRSGLSVEGRLVLDFCCNSGIMLLYALNEGALWALGWDLPDVISQTRKLHKALGSTRMEFKDSLLESKYDFCKDVSPNLYEHLEGCIVLYLAAWKHIGFLEQLDNIAFKAIVFEGHEGEELKNLEKIMIPILNKWRCRVASRTEIRDGYSSSRPLLILVRD